MPLVLRPRTARRLAVRPLLAFIWLLFACQATAQRDPANARFLRYPFDKWAAENAKPQINWTVRIAPPHLSPHQRLLAQLHLTVEAGELRKHAGNGQIILFVRMEDAAGHRYQTSGQIPVSQLHQGDRFLQLDYTVSAFVLPGDYSISLAICDSNSLEHTFVRRRLHVAEINSDPLPVIWNGLPSVEFLPPAGNPDAWFLPRLRSFIALPLKTSRPLHVELLVNTTPSTPGSLNMFRQNMELIVPSLRVLTGLSPANGSVGLSTIDLNRRVISYRQPDLHPANRIWNDWFKLRSAFNEFGGATVDATTLAAQRQMLDYFAEQAAKSLNFNLDPAAQVDESLHVLIVLSAPVFFTQQEKPPPPDLPPDPRHRIFYISYSPTAIASLPGSLPAGRIGLGTADGGPVSGATIHRPLYIFTDDLERVLKPMGARVFRVSKPEEFRKALAAILGEIERM